MIQFNWKQYFAPQIKSVELFESDTLSLIALFESHSISSAEFLKIFQKVVLLPQLQDEFFQLFSTVTALALFEKYQKLQSCWSPLCIPIGEWDGHLIVAGCFFETLPSDQNIIGVLASFEKTQSVWQDLKKQENFNIPFNPDIDPDEAPTLPKIILDQIQQNAEQAKHRDTQITNFETEASRDSDATAILVDPDAIEVTQKFNLHSIEKTISADSFQEKLSALGTSAKNSIIELQDNSMEPAEVAQLLDEESPHKSLNTTETSELLEGIELNFKSTPMGLDVNSQPLVEPLTVIAKDHLGENEEITNIGFKIESTSWDQIKPIWADIQDELSTFFDSCLLVSINSDLESFKGVLWSSNINPKKSETNFQLKNPSIFRVVYTTFKPYHGYVVSNEINESFFAVWNENEIPAHVSIAPILVNQNMKALLIGIGNVSSFTSNSLALIEKMAEKISENLKSPKDISKSEVA